MFDLISIIIISIFLSAFFSGMEMAFLSANKLQIEIDKKKEGFISKILAKLTNRSSKFITTMLVGNNIVLVIYSIYMGEFILRFLALDGFSEFSILLIQTLISTFLILLLAEFLPKIFFRIYADEALKIFAIPAYLFYIIFHYFSDFITAISDFLLKLVLKSSNTEKPKEFSKVELGNFITQQLEKAKDVDEVDSEIQIFQNALEFNNIKAREVMIPRTEINAVEINDDIETLNQLFISSGNSKIIVYDKNLDNVLGYVHAFDMFKKSKNIQQIIKPIEMIPESMRINYVLNMLIKKRKSIAIVLDEYGGTSGLLTVEDIVEVLFGDIEDEHDSIELLENQLSETEFEFSSRLEVDYINDTYKLDLPEDESYETLGGMLMSYTETIPELGEIIEINQYQFTITKVSSNKIETVFLLIKEDK
ncbi:MAG: hemolysin family protein [Flavobacteriaceae bacterium]|nr:hemolysin family protein [Flavobacteriaceae bacterium]